MLAGTEENQDKPNTSAVLQPEDSTQDLQRTKQEC